MAEFGQTGKWLILPVKLCVLFLGAYYVFMGLFKLGMMIFSSTPMILTVNDTANIFGDEPTAAFLEQFPEAAQFRVITWLVQLHKLQLIILCLAGIVTVQALFCFYTIAAYVLYLLTWVYGAVFFFTHAGILLCYQRRELLDLIPSFRGQKEFQVLFFGELAWPSSFWYQYAAQMILKIYIVYSIADLYYSWYQILRVGGSGWELLAANQLPGWERYRMRQQEKLERKMHRRVAPGQQQRQGGGGGDTPSPEDLERLLNYLQRQSGAQPHLAAVRPPFGDLPAVTGIPVRLS